MCRASGITFIGPSPEVLRSMGDKDSARQTMKNAGIPVIPGSGILECGDEAVKAAASVGYPLLIKASAGGGGKGIRIVEREDELIPLMNEASAEAKNAFGDGFVFLEKYLTNVRHVEMQLIADEYGNAVCLGERDCSLQKNRQKVVEEAPCPSLNVKVRREMMAAAEKIAKTVGYTHAARSNFCLRRTDNSTSWR